MGGRGYPLQDAENVVWLAEKLAQSAAGAGPRPPAVRLAVKIAGRVAGKLTAERDALLLPGEARGETGDRRQER
ncbi:MAG: hypothetical protein IPH82_26685 [Chloroflexi bacterium]|nr:hypothetical protein [Chloroflexota bacterium]